MGTCQDYEGHPYRGEDEAPFNRNALYLDPSANTSIPHPTTARRRDGPRGGDADEHTARSAPGTLETNR